MMRAISKRFYSIILISAVLIGMYFITATEAIASINGEYRFCIEHIDVEQGDAVIVQCENNYLMIDGGSPLASSLIYATLEEAGDDALWLPGVSSQSVTMKKGRVVSAPEKITIPLGTTFVINKNTKKFHLTTCSSVNEMSAKNRVFSTDSAENLARQGYSPCKKCHPDLGSGEQTDDKKQVDKLSSKETENTPVQTSGTSYVLNTNTKKFHNPGCSSVSSMSSKNRKDVVSTRDEIIAQGYDPCKKCKP